MRSALEAITRNNNTSQNRSLHAATWIAASLAIAIGAFMVVAWHSHSAWLSDSFPGLFYMKYNTALALVAGGAGLIAAMLGNKNGSLAAGGVVLAIGLLTLLEYAVGLDLGIDQLLINDTYYPNNPLHGRMAPSVALSLACFGGALILLASEARRGLTHVATMEALSFIVLAAGATAIAGYLTNAELAYSWGSTARVAVATAIGLVALGIGLVALVWQYQSLRIARVPLWLPALLCFLVLLLDLSTPRGLAGAIAYIPIIFCSLWFTRPTMAFVFASITTALAVLGYISKAPEQFEFWTIATASRAMTIAALWFVAALVYLRRRSEIVLRGYMAELERSNQELDEFAYIASHDLKEPLRGLFNHAQFLMEDYKDKLDAEGVRRLNRLRALCQRMERLIDDLMYFSRLGRADLAIQKTDLTAVISEIRHSMDVFIDERHAHIDVPRQLPNVYCDRPRTSEVFRNLITNAVKYNDSAEPRVEIGFKDIARSDSGLERNVFYVKDNGRGIAPEFHQEIFRIFKRLQAPDAKETGTGVGLTFVKKIVEHQGGRVWLDSEIGKGTTFYFTLACTRTDPAKDPHEHGIIPIAVHSAG